MRNNVRSFEAGHTRIEVTEYTTGDIPFLYTVTTEEEDAIAPVIESFHIELYEAPSDVKNKVINIFNDKVKEFLSHDIVQ